MSLASANAEKKVIHADEIRILHLMPVRGFNNNISREKNLSSPETESWISYTPGKHEDHYTTRIQLPG
jgi:hypothetical protein